MAFSQRCVALGAKRACHRVSELGSRAVCKIGVVPKAGCTSGTGCNVPEGSIGEFFGA